MNKRTILDKGQRCAICKGFLKVGVSMNCDTMQLERDPMQLDTEGFTLCHGCQIKYLELKFGKKALELMPVRWQLQFAKFIERGIKCGYINKPDPEVI